MKEYIWSLCYSVLLYFCFCFITETDVNIFLEKNKIK